MLDELMYDEGIEQLRQSDSRSARRHCHCAAVFARLGESEKAIEQLTKAAEYARGFDYRPNEAVVSSVLLGETTVRKTDFETDDARALTEIMRDKWLASPDFDAMRNTVAFEKIISILNS